MAGFALECVADFIGIRIPENWDMRLREQEMEAYLIYERLGMTEVMPDAVNPRANLLDVGVPLTSNLKLLIAQEPTIDPIDIPDTENLAASTEVTSSKTKWHPTSTSKEEKSPVRVRPISRKHEYF
jgi:hypothetical protein